MKKILILVLMLLFCSVPAWGMTLEQMKALPGGDMVRQNLGALVKSYGVPALILDPAAKGQNQKRKIKVGDKLIPLTFGFWTFVYAPKQNEIYTSARKEKSIDCWVNPNPIMPASFNRVEHIAFSSLGLTNNLDDYNITGVYGNFSKHIPLNSIFAKFGEPEQLGPTEDGSEMARYWIVLYGKDNYPYRLYLVDFYIYEEYGEKFVVDYQITSDLIVRVRDSLKELQNAWQNGTLDDEANQNEAASY